MKWNHRCQESSFSIFHIYKNSSYIFILESWISHLECILNRTENQAQWEHSFAWSLKTITHWNYVLQNISFNKSHWDQPLYNSKWVFCTMKWNGEGNGNPLQYSCLGNPMDRRTWQATVREVTKSWTPIEHKMKKDHKVTYQSLYSIKENLLIYWFTTLITRKKRVKF